MGKLGNETLHFWGYILRIYWDIIETVGLYIPRISHYTPLYPIVSQAYNGI
jgi:hypothetical protein